MYLEFITSGETVSFDTSRIISVGGEGIILDSGNYDTKKNSGYALYDQNKAKMNGIPSCTKYTLDKNSCNYAFYHFNPAIVDENRIPPEYFSTQFKSEAIISNIEIYFCKLNNDVIIGTGNYCFY